MKTVTSMVGGLILLLMLTSNSFATVMVYPEGEYTSSEGYYQLGYYANPRYLPWHESFSMGHHDIHEWTLNDRSEIFDLEGEDEYLKVVFHGIYNNYEPDDDMISLYLRNDDPGMTPGIVHKEDPNTPGVWDGWLAFDGTWSYPTPADPDDWGFQDGSIAFDVVFSILIDETIEEWMTDGGTFTVGIDTDCHYNGNKITVEAPAPVPEPATMLLLGTGLLGITGRSIRKKKISR